MESGLPMPVKTIPKFRDMPGMERNADKRLIRLHFDKIYLERNHNSMKSKLMAQAYLIAALINILGNDSILFMKFEPTFSPINLKGDPPTEGLNIIGVLKGPDYGTSEDKAMFIGAHYDTVPESPGIVDNGSGTIAVLELARLLNNLSKKSKIPFTVYFILFDLEEYGLLGSFSFVNSFVSDAVTKKTFGVLGAFTFDMILTFNPRNNTQDWLQDQSFLIACPVETKTRINSGSRGNFISVWLRSDADEVVSNSISAAFRSNEIKLSICSNSFPKYVREFNDKEKMQMTVNDSIAKYTIPAVLMTDLGPYRVPISHCYHKKCDNLSFLTAENLHFLTTVIDTAFNAIEIIIKDPPAPVELLRCNDCYFKKIEDRWHVLCRKHGRHKQRERIYDPRTKWIVTHVTRGGRPFQKKPEAYILNLCPPGGFDYKKRFFWPNWDEIKKEWHPKLYKN
ncbi:uncharacterized protein B4U80_07102 [Leptotrombidium deliense]|uniref:Peptidase M28 domain-containing protein n=1 Tax=Leptotrombidium deliense TaxID=299467 RepID=A0A443SC65_9ACAR|nr:uncharacterized protein B4U80_07102 [Leptotrombidium deliense]